MNSNAPITLVRDVEGTMVPAGTKVTLQQGESAIITQSLGGNYTVVVNGNMFRLEAKDADALGLEVAAKPIATTGTPGTAVEIEQEAWIQMRTCFDPEIPVNIVDLGLVYGCEVTEEDGGKVVDIKMTLTAPGCGMGPTIAADAQGKVMQLQGIANARVELVWEPAWNQGMISEVGRMQLGMV